MIGWRGGLVITLAALAALVVGNPAVWASEPGKLEQEGPCTGALSAGTLEELETSVRAEMDSALVPGLAYVVVQGDQVVYAKGFGVRKLGSGDAVDTHTVFEIGSASKAFTATMLAMVVEEGKLAWDDRVVDHLPQFRMQDPWVTHEFRVADLVCQRSGMPPYSLDGMSYLGFGRADIIRALHFVEPVTSFRSAFAYQNNLWLVAAALIEQKSGLTWEDNLDRRIFGPLGMVESTTSPEVLAGLPNVATGHFLVSETELQPIPPDWPYRHWIDTYGPAGSIRSTVIDLAQWLRLQINLGVVGQSRLLGAASVAYLHAPKTLVVVRGGTPNPTIGGDVMSYASGWVFQTSHRHPIVWHNGGTTGMHSIVGYIPEAQMGLAMLTNEPSNLVPEHALFKLADLVLGQPAGTTSVAGHALDMTAPRFVRRHVVSMGPPLSLERYVGTFVNPAYGPFEVRLSEGRLELVFGPLQHVGVLQPYSGNTFLMEWPAWPGMVSVVTFTVPAGQPAEKLTASWFEDVRSGEFVRVPSSSTP
ncbi:MAG: serine hydrolase [Thermoanaerobaculales bacterium]